MDIITALAEEHEIDLNEKIITVYFEWCGGSIQKKSAVSGMEKMAIIFRMFKVSPVLHDTDGSRWYETTSKGAWMSTTSPPMNLRLILLTLTSHRKGL
mmetsp:Transcript_17037/g.25792  ORF Transcript_17037/g.25792 Transcript_17037/m.25792 type:complete len:98 (+) Transcript_17037:280-573(+)